MQGRILEWIGDSTREWCAQCQKQSVAGKAAQGVLFWMSYLLRYTEHIYKKASKGPNFSQVCKSLHYIYLTITSSITSSLQDSSSSMQETIWEPLRNISAWFAEEPQSLYGALKCHQGIATVHNTPDTNCTSLYHGFTQLCSILRTSTPLNLTQHFTEDF